ncbi:MAG: ATP phosphoribosyltransferase regulatory subunit, partial [Clostridia bacterium]|nr:ATP phosphoribosyltransferase regulatory subunit [Clostridia bacterium]
LLDCKEQSCRALAAEAPKISDCLCEDCKAHFASVVEGLEKAGVKYRIDPNTVRGLDYYTKTVFELIADGANGAAATLGGGGRYDGMIGELGGPELGGIGFAVGLSRLALAMPEGEAKDEKPLLYVAPMGGRAAGEATVICEKLRSAGLPCETDLVGRSLKAQMKYADKSGFAYTAVIGDSELDAGRCVLRSMSDGKETETAISEIAATLKKLTGDCR